MFRAYNEAMDTINIEIPDDIKNWMQGHAPKAFAAPDEYIIDLIRRDRARSKASVDIQRLVDDGLESGPAEPFDMNAFLSEKQDAH